MKRTERAVGEASVGVAVETVELSYRMIVSI